MDYSDQGRTNAKEAMLAKFPKKFLDDLERLKRQGYCPKEARVNWTEFWKNEEMEREIRILLPEIKFERRASH